MSFIHKLNNRFTDNLKLKPVILIALGFLAIYVFYFSIFAFAVNIPYWDDYDSILNFSNNFLGSSLKDKVPLIFSQHNEHRIVFTRISTLASYYLTGKINFKFLIFIGNISLIGLLIIFLRSAAFAKKKFLYFIPAIFLLFQPQYWGDIYFATSSLSSLCVLFFAFASLYLLKKESLKYFIFSLLLALLASFTGGNGMIVFFAGLLTLIYEKKYLKIIIWIFVGAGCILFYFHGYTKPPHHPSIADPIFVHPIHTIIYLFSFLGSCFLNSGFNHAKPVYFLALLSGVLFSLYFIYLIKIKFYKRNIAIASFLLFLILTSCVTALCRSGFDLFPSRYKIISTLILVLSYLTFMETLLEGRMKRLFPILLTCSILFNFISYRNNFNYVILQKKYLIEGLALWESNSPGLSYPDEDRANSIISTAISKGRYSPPKFHK
jgi:hypothetical protein